MHGLKSPRLVPISRFHVAVSLSRPQQPDANIYLRLARFSANLCGWINLVHVAATCFFLYEVKDNNLALYEKLPSPILAAPSHNPRTVVMQKHQSILTD